MSIDPSRGLLDAHQLAGGHGTIAGTSTAAAVRRRCPADAASQYLARHPRALWLLAVALAPLAVLGGYGTDIDAAGVRQAGEAIRHGSYVLSRPPGSLVHEAATAVLDRIGGSVATNLASVLMGTILVVSVARVLHRAGAPHAELASLSIAANPHFVIASTSLVDHVWALGFFAAGLDAAQRRRPVVAGLLWAAAISSRLATVVLVAAYVVAALPARQRERRALAAGALGLALGALAFVPAWLSVGRSRAFLENSFGSPSLVSLLGRWALKQELFLGLPALVLVVVALPVLVRTTRDRRAEPLVRFAVLGLLATELVFLRLPWKLAHVLPVLVCLVVLAGLSRLPARWFVALALLQLLWGLVAVRLVVPDVRDQASAARIDVAVVAGALVADTRCRQGRPLPEDERAPDAYERSVDAFRCAYRWAYGDAAVEAPSP